MFFALIHIIFSDLQFPFEELGEVRIYLKSKLRQDVRIKALNETITLEAGERIETEISRKYNDDKIRKLLIETKFSIKDKVMDDGKLYADYILECCK